MQNLSGIGMTSQRTRERLLGRLMDQGIQSMGVLDIMRSTPRHIFLDEALAHRLMKMWHCLSGTIKQFRSLTWLPA